MKNETNHEGPGKHPYNAPSVIFAPQNINPWLEGNLPEHEKIVLMSGAG
jgi:hypothetical protein